jgi:hypothetical protein
VAAFLKRRITYTNIAVTAALLFAMAGGAYAASKYVITSKKQISPTVLKQLKGARGQSGPAGVPGKEGAAGKDGTNGTNGTNATNGTNGKDGVSATSVPFSGEKTLGSEKCQEGGLEVTSASGTNLVCNGTEGTPGHNGSPWTPNSELPAGATETGTFYVAHLGSDPNDYSVVSFPIKLHAAPEEARIKVLKFEETTPGCEGTVDAPTAASGFFCVYLGKVATIFAEADEIVTVVKDPSSIAGADESTAGAIIAAEWKNAPEGGGVSDGAWAVTG